MFDDENGFDEDRLQHFLASLRGGGEKAPPKRPPPQVSEEAVDAAEPTDTKPEEPGSTPDES
jgi:hypothetical protein